MTAPRTEAPPSRQVARRGELLARKQMARKIRKTVAAAYLRALRGGKP